MNYQIITKIVKPLLCIGGAIAVEVVSGLITKKCVGAAVDSVLPDEEIEEEESEEIEET